MKKIVTTALLCTSFSGLAFMTACGSKSDSKDTPAASTTSTYTYAADTKAIIDTNCATAGCHANGTAAPLDTLARVKVAATAMTDRIKRTDGKIMPPSDKTFAASANGVKLLDWLAGGADLK